MNSSLFWLGLAEITAYWDEAHVLGRSPRFGTEPATQYMQLDNTRKQPW